MTEAQREARNKIKALAKEAGIDVVITVAKGRKIAIKYRNPDNPAETWTGRGIAPKWTVGKDLDQCIIEKAP